MYLPLHRKLGHEVDGPIKFHKSKLIAQAYAKRGEFQNQGRLSINFQNSHTDPVGMNFDLNSVASNDLSSTWANNLPRFLNRRYALTGATTSMSSHGPRRNSVDSEISFSVRHVSVESRRNSVDSQVSVKAILSEVKTKVASRSRGNKGRSTRNQHHHHRRRDIYAGRKFSRRESSTSMESQIITALQKAKYSDKGGLFMPNDKNMKRRTANAGLDSNQIDAILSNGKLMFPFLQNQGMTTSDEENGSTYREKNARLDVILKQIAACDSESEYSGDENAKQRCEIYEYNTTDDEKMNIRNSNLSGHKKNYPSIQSANEQKRPHDDLLAVKSSREGGRISKNSTKSVRSRQSSRGSANRRNNKSIRSSNRGEISKSFKPQTIDKKEKEKDDKYDDFDDSSFASYCSELSPLAGAQSSFSGVSLAKSNSRNSKRSCDVGIQTNAHEITTQTMSSFEMPANHSSNYERNQKSSKDDENLNIYTECHNLMSPKTRKESSIQDNYNRRGASSAPKNKRNLNKDALTETEKLKLLLLPSN